VKFFLRLAVVAVLGLLLVLGLLVFFRNGFIETAVEKAGQFAFGVPTPLEEVRTDLGSGAFALVDYEIENPEGFSDRPVFALGNASMELPLMRLRGDDELRIPEVRVEGLAILLERNDQGFNFSPLLDRIQKLTAASDDTGAKPPTTEPSTEPSTGPTTEPAKSGRPIVIERLVLADWTLALDFGGALKLAPHGLDTLVLENVRTDGQGLPGILAQVTEQLLGYVQTEGLGAVGLGDLSPELLAQIDGLRAKLGQDLPNLDELKAKLQGRVDEKVDELEALGQERLDELRQDARGEVESLLDKVTGGQELPPGAAEKLDELLNEVDGAELPADLKEKANDLLEKLSNDPKAKSLEEKAKKAKEKLGGLLGGGN
jgi:hypothetical protein